jgi:hypothetical protein
MFSRLVSKRLPSFRRPAGGYWETMAYLTPKNTYSLVEAPPASGHEERLQVS